jgi:regulator of replication initiation timing
VRAGAALVIMKGELMTKIAENINVSFKDLWDLHKQLKELFDENEKLKERLAMRDLELSSLWSQSTIEQYEREELGE